MLKRLPLVLLGLFLFCTANAEAPLIDAIRVEPTEIPARIVTQVLFTARIASDAQHIPKRVSLLRLQWSGNEAEVARLWDDGSHGDVTKKDGVYTCDLKLKEPIIGLLSFRIEVLYKGIRTPVRSNALFVKIVGS